MIKDQKPFDPSSPSDDSFVLKEEPHKPHPIPEVKPIPSDVPIKPVKKQWIPKLRGKVSDHWLEVLNSM